METVICKKKKREREREKTKQKYTSKLFRNIRTILKN